MTTKPIDYRKDVLQTTYDREHLLALLMNGFSRFFIKCCFVGLTVLSQLCFSQALGHGTTLVVVRNRDSIIIGADSKMQVTGEVPLISILSPRPSAPASVDRIRICGDIAFAVAGFYTRPRIGFDVFKIAQSACSNAPNLFQSASLFRIELEKPLLAAWADIQTDFPRRNVEDFPVAFVAGGFYQGIPFVIIHTFVPRTIRNGIIISAPPEAQIASTRFPLSTAPDSTYHKIFSDSVNDQMLSSISNLIASDPISFVRLAIKKAIDVDPSKNGGPIAILCIHRDGMTWIPSD